MKKIILFVIAFFVATNLYAQEPTGLPFITDYTQLKTGFYGIDFQSIQQDNNGTMYFGAVAQGNTIVQYDGVSWSTIPSKHTGTGVTRCMTKDSTGTIFYGGGQDFGLLSRDSTGQTVSVSLLQYVPPIDKRNFFQIWSVQVARNSVYFEANKKLFRLTKTGTGKNVSWVCKTWDSKTGFGSIFYLDNTLYVREWGAGLLKMVKDSLQLIHGSEFLGKQVIAMLNFSDSTGKKEYLLGTYKNGLYLFDGKHFTPFHTQADQWLKGNILDKAIIVNKDDYALGIIGAGVVIINPKGKVLQVINKKSGLTSNSIYSLFWDGHHNLWVGMDNGICKVALNLPFTRFFNQPGLTSIVKCMAKLPDGSLYAGTNNGAAKYNPVTAQFESISSLPKGQIFSMVPDGNELLVGGGGLYVVQGNKVSLVKKNTITGQLLISKRYPNMLYAVTNSGLEVFVRDKSYRGGWRYLGNVPGLPNNNHFEIAEQPDGKLWGNVIMEYPFRLTFSTGKNGIPVLSKTRVEKLQAGRISKKGIQPFLFKNKIIFGGGNFSSTYAYNDVLKKFIRDTVLLAAGDTLESYVSGLNNITWAYSQKGKYDYFTSSETGERFRIDTSLTTLINDFGDEYTYPGSNGIIWLPALDGLIRYDTKVPFNDTLPFNVLIRKITLGKMRFNPYPSSSKLPEIKYSRHTFRFDYAAPYFLDEKETQYQTRLEGFHTEWSSWGKNTYKEYTNLPYGKYVFSVRAKNVLGIISREADFSFIILPPWYRTWWAYIIYAIIIIAIVWGLIAYRSRNLKKKNQQLEQKVSLRTNELQQSLENLKSTQKQLIQSEKMASLGELTAGIAHEIQNPLNFVNNFSEVNRELIAEMKGEFAKGNGQLAMDIANDVDANSEKIIHHGKRADAIVKGMLQHSRVSSGQREPTNINALADEYFRLSYHGMRAKDKSFNATMKTDFDESIGRINVVPQDIGRVFLNLFNNAFYACAERSRSSTGSDTGSSTDAERSRSASMQEYTPTVWVSTKRIADGIPPLGGTRGAGAVEIRVRDNGNGIPEKIKDKIFQPFFTTKPTGEGTGLGLSLSYDMVKAHDGEITVNSVESEGTEFVVTLPV